MDEEKNFEWIARQFIDLFAHVSSDDIETFELIFDTLVDHQITLLTGSKYLSNIKKEFSELAVQVGIELGFNVYVEEEAYDTVFNERKLIDGFVGLYTWDIQKNHFAFWDRFDELKEMREIRKAIRKTFD